MKRLTLSLTLLTVSTNLWALDLSPLIENRDFNINKYRAKVYLNSKDYNFEITKNLGEFKKTDDSYSLIIDKNFPSHRISKIKEVYKTPKNWKDVFNVAVGNKFTKKYRGSISTFDQEGNLISRTACSNKFISSRPMQKNYACRTITKNRCSEAMKLKSKLHSLKDQINKCVDLGKKLEGFYSNKADLKIIKENWNSLKDEINLPRWKEPKAEKHQASLLAHHENLIETVRLCEKYKEFFKGAESIEIGEQDTVNLQQK